MNEIQKYPDGIEYREPRPRTSLSGLILSSYALGKNRLDEDLLTSAMIQQPLSLSQALRKNFTEKGFDVINFYRLGRFGAKILFFYQGVYWTLESRAPQNPEMTQEQIEDWLYGDLIKKAENFPNQEDMRLQP